MLFHSIPDAQCVLRSRGVFRQVPMFRRNQQLFAKWSSGFVMLRTNGGTSIPHVSWDHIEGVEYLSPAIGALQVPVPEPAAPDEEQVARMTAAANATFGKRKLSAVEA